MEFDSGRQVAARSAILAWTTLPPLRPEALSIRDDWFGVSRAQSASGRLLFYTAPWMAMLPGAAIFLGE